MFTSPSVFEKKKKKEDISWLLQEREAEYEAQQRQTKKEKELEIARLRARQEKAKDYKADQVRNKATCWFLKPCESHLTPITDD